MCCGAHRAAHGGERSWPAAVRLRLPRLMRNAFVGSPLGATACHQGDNETRKEAVYLLHKVSEAAAAYTEFINKKITYQRTC